MVRALSLLAISQTLVGCSPIALVMSRDDLNRLLRESGGDLMPEEVEPGVWSVPSSADSPIPGTRMQSNGLTWEMVGQYQYPVVEETSAELQVPEWRTIGPQTITPYDELASKSFVDSLGGEWRVVDISVDDLSAAIDRDSLNVIPEADPVGEGYVWPMAWSDVSCPSINNKGSLAYGAQYLRAYNGDDRDTQSSDSDYTERKRLAVAIFRRSNCNTDWDLKADDYICSGTLIGPDDILTAGHCLSTPSGNGAAKYGTCHFRVCTLGNLHTASVGGVGVDAACTTVEAVEVHSEYLNWRHDNYDIGYLQLTDSPGDDLGYMGLSAHSNNATERLVHHATYSPWKKSGGVCAENISDSGSLADADLSNLHLIKEEGQLIFDASNGILETGFDAIGGHSGSPLWWCPDGSGGTSCDTGDPAEVLGVFHAWVDVYADTTNDHTDFVSVPARKSWIEGNL